MKKIHNKTIERIRLYVIVSLFAAIIGLNLYLQNSSVLVNDQMPMPFGYGIGVVLSGSMEPVLSVNDLIIVKAEDDYQVDDVVVYQAQDELIVHRIIYKNDNIIITQGDANNAADDAFDKNNIKGKVVFIIPGIGIIIDALSTPLANILLVIIIISLLVSAEKEEAKNNNDELDKLRHELEELKKNEETKQD